MGLKSPLEATAEWARLLNERNKPALLALYDKDAIFTIDGATVARGTREIEAMMAPLFDGPLKIRMTQSSCHVSGETAVVRSDWKLLDPSGAVAMAGSSAEVFRKGADGLWRFVIDDASFASRPAAA